MRFIILAPILCLLAIVTAYPMRQARSLEEPAGGLTQREVTQEIHRRGFWSNIFKPTQFDVNWSYANNATDDTPGALNAKKKAKKKTRKHLVNKPPDDMYPDLTTISITLSYDATSKWWSAVSTCRYLYNEGSGYPPHSGSDGEKEFKNLYEVTEKDEGKPRKRWKIFG